MGGVGVGWRGLLPNGGVVMCGGWISVGQLWVISFRKPKLKRRSQPGDITHGADVDGHNQSMS